MVTASAMARSMALGADWCNSARAFMFAVGCIQSQRCHTNRCPVGVTTQDPKLQRALIVPDKAERVHNYHRNTVHALAELIAAMGLDHTSELSPHHAVRRVSQFQALALDEIYDFVQPGELLDGTALRQVPGLLGPGLGRVVPPLVRLRARWPSERDADRNVATQPSTGRGMTMLTDVLTTVALAVNPVPWARSQMAFTLAFHIILVPLGVSWSVMTLIANYRGIRHDDRDAMLLAQRWSKYMAVTFAVGAVTGTVLSFEFGLLWPKFMGQWGAAFGVPFAFEGIFFFTEAIFISIYIFGWRRLRPWAHFWTGVPIAVAGIFGSISVVAANAWMNSPQGVTLDSSGKVTDVDPMGVIFNDAMPLMAAHMVVAAYLVGGFMIASVYAVGMLRGRTDRYHRMGFIIGFTVAAIATPIQMGVGDTLARWVYDEQPTKFAAIEMVPETSSDVPEVLLGHLNSEGEVVGGLPIPGLASMVVRPEHRKVHRYPGARRDARR